MGGAECEPPPCRTPPRSPREAVVTWLLTPRTSSPSGLWCGAEDTASGDSKGYARPQQSGAPGRTVGLGAGLRKQGLGLVIGRVAGASNTRFPWKAGVSGRGLAPPGNPLISSQPVPVRGSSRRLTHPLSDPWSRPQEAQPLTRALLWLEGRGWTPAPRTAPAAERVFPLGSRAFPLGSRPVLFMLLSEGRSRDGIA